MIFITFLKSQAFSGIRIANPCGISNYNHLSLMAIEFWDAVQYASFNLAHFIRYGCNQLIVYIIKLTLN